jgi:colicin import membrane protein
MTEKEGNLIELTVARPDEALFNHSKHLMELAQNYEITSPEMAVAVGDDLKAVKTLAKQIEDKRTSITKPLNQALREVNALFKPAKNWLKKAEGLIKDKLLKFQREQERIARELQAKADEEARKERVRLEKKASDAELVGEPDRAEDLREQAEIQEAPVIASTAPKLEGIATRKTWKAEVTNKLLFVKYVAEKRNDLLGLIKIDQSALNAQARSLKDSLDLPGIKVEIEETIVARN